MEVSDWIGISSIVIAITALAVTLWQAHIARKHNRLSLAPNLIVHTDTGTNCCSFTLENNGLGPAVIKEFYLVVGDNEIPAANYDAQKKAMKMLKVPLHYSSYFVSIGEHIAPGKRIELLDIETGQQGDVEFFVKKLKQNLKYKVVYTSMYQDKDYKYLGNT